MCVFRHLLKLIIDLAIIVGVDLHFKDPNCMYARPGTLTRITNLCVAS